MTVQELLECTLPILVDSRDDDHPYWFGGTWFLYRFRDELFVLTARHCLKGKDRNDVRLQRRADSSNLIPLVLLLTPTEDSPERDRDTDANDWAIFHVSKVIQEPEDPFVLTTDLSRMLTAIFPPNPEAIFLVRGYPMILSNIDYETKKLQWQAFAGSGKYEGPASWSPHVQTMRLDNVSSLKDLNGLSGSPVFKVESLGSVKSVSFAGMVLRGSVESGGLVHFLDAQLLRSKMQEAYNIVTRLSF